MYNKYIKRKEVKNMKYKFIKKVENKVYMFKDLIRDQYVLYDHGDVYVVDDMYITL